MYKISAFSKLSRVSVKTLRYYDELGMLKPIAVDEASGYRYYSPEQLLTVQRILAYKELGLTLEQIMPLLTGQATPQLVLSTLERKRAELEQLIQEAMRQISEIDKRMQHIDEDDDMTEKNPAALQTIETQLVASIRDTIPRMNICLLLDELKRYVESYGQDPEETLMVLWHECGSEDEHADIEVAIRIKREITSSDRVKVGHLPRLTKAATLVHHCDPYANTCSATHELASWMSANGYRPADREPIREVYLTTDKNMYGKSRKAMLVIPVEKV
ncbi:MerR family transcriptional regulator [Brevibacillus migulae]|uniref:MerR family transcriptional regulator n=1 Tax=Brevibacillus migulae TaxID=1644114 RepID=UPI00106DDF16|nr:MerR family transcriptional regulator [Brevibacillus migulae]